MVYQTQHYNEAAAGFPRLARAYACGLSPDHLGTVWVKNAQFGSKDISGSDQVGPPLVQSVESVGGRRVLGSYVPLGAADRYADGHVGVYRDPEIAANSPQNPDGSRPTLGSALEALAQAAELGDAVPMSVVTLVMPRDLH